MTLSLWARRPAPHTGFGYQFNTSVKFMTITGRGEPLPDWTGGPQINQFRILGSGRMQTQRGPRMPYELAVRLWLPDAREVEELHLMQGREASLWLYWGITKTLGGALESIAGIDYLRLDDVMLLSVQDDGTLEYGVNQVSVTFQVPVEGAAS